MYAHNFDNNKKKLALLPNLRVDVNHGGEEESQRLSRAGCGDPDHVAAEQRHGPALALDGGGRGEPLLHHLPEHVLGHGGLLEGHGRLGDALPLDDNPALVAPGRGLVVAALRHVRVLDVEVLRGNGCVVCI